MIPSCSLEPHVLWFYKSESSYPAGINLHLPMLLRTKKPLTLRTTWQQYNAVATPAGVGVFELLVAGKSVAHNRLVPLAVLSIYVAFVGGFTGREDAVHDVDLSPYLSADIESITLIFTRTGGIDDTLEGPVGFTLGRTLQ